jgi:hypothetical protein
LPQYGEFVLQDRFSKHNVFDDDDDGKRMIQACVEQDPNAMHNIICICCTPHCMVDTLQGKAVCHCLNSSAEEQRGRWHSNWS